MPVAGTVFAGFAGSGAVVHDHVRSEAVVLDETAALVWQLLDGSVSTSELAAELAEHFEMPGSRIAADIQTLCSDLETRGFLIVPG